MVDSEMGENASQYGAVALGGIVGFAPGARVQQLCSGGRKRLQVREVLSGALVDGGVELEVDLVDPGGEQDVQATAVGAVLCALMEAVWKPEVE
jgi:hypothetical protein